MLSVLLCVRAFSPDGLLGMGIGFNSDGLLVGRMSSGGIEVNFGISDRCKLISSRTVKEEYDVFGKHTHTANHYNEYNIETSNDTTLQIKFYNEGIAFRYLFSKEKTITQEFTRFSMGEFQAAFYQDDLGCYEGRYRRYSSIDYSTVVPMPVLFQVDKTYVMITESNVADFPDSALIKETGNSKFSTFRVFYHANREPFRCVETPYRIIIVTDSLNTLYNTDIVQNSVGAPVPKPDWVKPGRSSWQWLSSGAPVLEEQSTWLNLTKELGFDYYLIDDGWKHWKDPWNSLKRVIESTDVKCFVWVDSKEIMSRVSRRSYLMKVKDSGAVGIKIDFIPRASFEVAKWYEETLKETQELELMVDFHGSTKPTGRERVYPHELTREAVRGHEYESHHLKNPQEPIHDTILPFTRYVQGFADYTGTVLNANDRGTETIAREVAQSIVFTSPFLCFGDNPKEYLSSYALPIIKEIQPVWDESKVLEGTSVGKVVSVARRSGNRWFIGMMNGEHPLSIPIPYKEVCSGICSMQYIDDQSEGIKSIVFDGANSFAPFMEANGGFAGIIAPIEEPINEL